jgi:hypothetical protein
MNWHYFYYSLSTYFIHPSNFEMLENLNHLTALKSFLVSSSADVVRFEPLRVELAMAEITQPYFKDFRNFRIMVIIFIMIIS